MRNRKTYLATQKELVLRHLKQAGRITPLQAMGQYSVFRLAAVVHRLRKDGHDIKTQIQDAPNGGSYAEYRLEPKPQNPNKYLQRQAYRQRGVPAQGALL